MIDRPREYVAGRELDALIVERVMGLPVWWEDVFWQGEQHMGEPMTLANPNNPDEGKWFVPEYSTDITAAWEVVERLSLAVGPGLDGGWWAGVPDHRMGGNKLEDSAPTAPLAICRTALRVRGRDS